MTLSKDEFTTKFVNNNAGALTWFTNLTDEQKQYIVKNDFNEAAKNLIEGDANANRPAILAANVTVENINDHTMFQALLAAAATAAAAAALARTDSFTSPNHIVIAGQLDTNIMGRSNGEDILKSNSKFYIAISSKNDTIQNYGYYYPKIIDNKEDATYVQPIGDVNELSPEKQKESKDFYYAIRDVIPGIIPSSISVGELKEYEKTNIAPQNITTLQNLFSTKTKGHMNYKDNLNSTYQLYFNYDDPAGDAKQFTSFNGKGKIVFLGSGLNNNKQLLKIRITKFTMVNGLISMVGQSNKSVEDLIYDLLGVTNRPEKPATIKQRVVSYVKDQYNVNGGSKTKITKKRKMNNKKISHKKNVSNKKRSLLSRKKVSK